MSVVIKTRKPKSNPGKRGGRKGPKPKGPKFTRKTVVVQQQQRRPRRNRKRNRGRRGNNSLMNSNMQAGRGGPTVRNTMYNRERVEENCEFVANITNGNSANFVNTAFSVNPGNVTMFPWLSTIAKQFQRYQFDYLQFEYVRSVTEFATAGTIGNNYMYFDVDASDGPPTAANQILDSEVKMIGMPCEDRKMAVPVRILKKFTDGFYVRPGNLPGGSDIKTYDVGNFNFATEGQSASSSNIGKLFVSYRVKLMEPVLLGNAQIPANNQVSWFQSTTPETPVTTTQRSMTLATATANGLNIVNTAGSMVPPSGNYVVNFTITAATATAANSVTLLVDFWKNGVTIFTSTQIPSVSTSAGAGPGDFQNVSACVFVTANGTDAFTLKETVTATGTLTSSGTCVWIAV